MKLFCGILLLFACFSLSWAAPFNTITIDGDLSDFSNDEFIVDDSYDTGWDVNNYIYGVYATWDRYYLYLGIKGKVDGNGWLLYLDAVGLDGFNDLTQIDTWDKNAVFPNNEVNFFYGSWAGAGGNFYRVVTATTAMNLSAEVATDFSTIYGGSEIKVKWATLFPEEHGKVPLGLSIAVVASLADGTELGGDSAPTGILNSTTTLDILKVFIVDEDNDGVPDNKFENISFSPKNVSIKPNMFSPNNDGIKDTAKISFTIYRTSQVQVQIFSLDGSKVADLINENFLVNYGENRIIESEWNPAGDIRGGVYLLNINVNDIGGGRGYSENFPIIVIK